MYKFPSTNQVRVPTKKSVSNGILYASKWEEQFNLQTASTISPALENLINPPLKGFTAWQHMCYCKQWALFWPDPLHLTARRTALTLVNSHATQFVKKLTRVFRMSRGPFHSSKFGKQIQACRKQLLDGLETGSFSESLLEAVLPGCARDCGTTEFGINDLKVLLKSASGQGFVFVKKSNV